MVLKALTKSENMTLTVLPCLSRCDRALWVRKIMASSTFSLVLGTGGLPQVGHLHQPQGEVIEVLKDHCKLASTHPEDTWADVVRPTGFVGAESRKFLGWCSSKNAVDLGVWGGCLLELLVSCGRGIRTSP